MHVRFEPRKNSLLLLLIEAEVNGGWMWVGFGGGGRTLRRVDIIRGGMCWSCTKYDMDQPLGDDG